jgi:hypothetical protein
MAIQTSSPRPARVSVEKTSRVDKDWQPAPEAVVSPTADKTRYLATLPIAGDKGLFRAKAVPIARQGGAHRSRQGLGPKKAQEVAGRLWT